MELALSRCVVRSFRKEDAPSLARQADNRKIWLNLRDQFPSPYTLIDAERWVREAAAMNPQTHFAIAVDGVAIGAIGLRLKTDVRRRTAEIGYWLGEEFWGRGIATEAVLALSEFALREFDLVRLYAAVFEGNPASARVLEKAGYEREARLRKAVVKDGRTLDLMLYALVRD